MSKMTVLIAGAAGYVLGARAGRHRYEQIKATAARVWNNPNVQSKVTVLEDRAADAAKAAAGVAQERASSAAGSVAEKVRQRSGSEGSGARSGTDSPSPSASETEPAGPSGPVGTA